MGYAVTFWTDPWGEYVGWRFSLAVQFIPAFIFAVGLPWLPETCVVVPPSLTSSSPLSFS